MTNKAVIYRPNSRWQIVAAFTAALSIHLSALAIASRSHTTLITNPDDGFAPVEVERAIEPAAPPVTEIPMPTPPPMPDSEFVERQTERPTIRRPAAPIRSPGQNPTAVVRNPKAFALSAPRPEYPYEARSQHLTGSGVAMLTVDSTTGLVVDAVMEPSTGNLVLDNSALSAFRHWRFKPGTPSKVRILITYLLTGASY